MSDVDFDKYEETQEVPSDQLDQKVMYNGKEVLMARADKLGISYSNNIGLETLRKRIEDKLDEADKAEEEELVKHTPSPLQKKRKEALQLIRVNITSMENTKNNLSGEIFTVSNNVIGTVKRYIPFGQDWHIERIFLDTLREKQFQRFTSVNTTNGSVRRAMLVPAYAIQELPPLTEKELDELRKSQMARNSIEK